MGKDAGCEWALFRDALVVFHSDVIERSDCPITEGHSLEFAGPRPPMVLHHVEVVAQQLEDEDGAALPRSLYGGVSSLVSWFRVPPWCFDCRDRRSL